MPTSRRRILRSIASAAAVAPMAGPLAAQHAHQAAKDLVQVAAGDYKPKFFSPAEFETLKTLVDLIIPRTDTPGASDAAVHRILDTDVSRRPAAQKLWRDGLAWVAKEAGDPFPALPQDRQMAILQAASDSADTPGGRFFTLLKGAVIDVYYTTKEGLRTELGWNANTFLPEFKGCTHKEHQV